MIGRERMSGREGDLVVIARRWLRRGRCRVVSAWVPTGVASDPAVAAVMVELLGLADPDTQARAVRRAALLREVGVEAQERILYLLRNPTTADRARAVALHEAAVAELASRGELERRSGRDRRSGSQRRRAAREDQVMPDRRSGLERRSGRDRRVLIRAVG
jgi:hypothetical protein